MSPAELEGPSGPFLEAVGAGALTAAVMLSVALWLDRTDIASPPLSIILLFVPIVAALVTAMAAALIGLPLTWLLARGGRETAWAYPAAGLVAGAAVTIAFFGMGVGGAGRPAAEWLLIASFGAAPGFVCGALWWLRYRRHVRAGRGT